MLRHIFDFLMGFLVRFILTPRGNASTPLIDLDGAFDRLSMITADVFERFQAVLLTVIAVASLGLLAVAVLVVRIFQLTSGVMVSVGSWQIDGAIIFGLVLAAIAFAVATFMVRSLKAPSAEARIRKAHEDLQRRAAEMAAATSHASPLEEAVAMAIRHFVESRERTQNVPAEEGDSVAPNTTKNSAGGGWNPDKMGQA